ncbi:helix-turn-helix domain-containing protein [Lactococcus garvieae]|uniref:helix-turn-helix domain-containing protein n=1 Tax=Lactococcus garvieae TaxID=1363 RepID=UPI002551964E|nr:helix-turn-helix domain-containing protein [Lactococcus garvieae]
MKKETAQIRLKRIMDERGLRQVDILRMSEPWQKKLDIKISKNTLSQYINGISSPDNHKATLLAKTLGVSEAWLLGYNVPRNDKETSTHPIIESPIIEETVVTMNKLDKPRQQIVLETAKKQHEQQEKEKVTSLEDYRLSDEFLEEQINEAVAYGGKPLSDNDKEFFKQLLKKTMKQKIDRGE